MREPVQSGQTMSEAWRRLQLRRLENLIKNHEEEILSSLFQDLGKPETEALFEIIAVKQELKLVQDNLSQWMRPKYVKVPISLMPGKAFVQLEPRGCVLIIGPWNYPFSLTIQPLISALAAGNTAVVKPSEHATATSNLISKLLSKYIPSEVVQVLEGDGELAAELVEKPFDHIFFTGGTAIGKKVMEAASKNLTSITLELGGKSPAIVFDGADLEVTAKRLVWGKCLNAGQTCIAPDHLMVKDELKAPLIKALKKTMLKFYGASPLNSKSLGRIVNQRQFNRLLDLLNNARDNNQIIFGGDLDKSSLQISPTLIEITNINDPLMNEELFGPLMPILTIHNLEDAISKIRALPRPLALYMFGGGKKEQTLILEQTSSGSICFNDVVLQAGIPELPFGGIGPSGMGSYHGLSGFETFSHKKSVFQRPFWLDFNLRYPPYKLDLSILKRLLG